MPPPEASGSYPVVRHFYPIDPTTSSQQSSPVYNSPSAPLVAPISSFSFPQPREPKAKASKRIRENDEDETEGLILTSPPQRSKRSRKDNNLQEQKIVSITLPPKKQRLQPYVEIPVLTSFDRSLYNPLSLSSSSVEYLTLGQRKRVSRPSSRILSWSPTPSPTPDKSYDPGPDNAFHAVRTNKEKRREIQVNDLFRDEEDATTCHQCRRKRKEDKMRCRNIRATGDVCTLTFCQPCIKLRYGEDFDPNHCSWHCPRCRGICNCSICLRKAGFGYLLDTLSAQISSARGHLNHGKKLLGVKQSKQISVREWLAHRGIALGTDEWTEERRHNGVRYIIGKSPPPLDVPSPYKEARLNPSLVACEHEHEDTSDFGFPLDPRLMGEGGVPPRVEVPPCIGERDSAGPSLHTAAPGPKKMPLTSVNLLAMSSPTPNSRQPSSSPLSSLEDDQPPPMPSDTEDLPGLSPAQTRRIRLIVGRPLPPSAKKNRAFVPLRKFKTLKTIKPKKRKTDSEDDLYYTPKAAKAKKRKASSEDDLDYTPSGKAGLTIRLPAIHVHKPATVPALDYDEKVEYKDEHYEAGSSSGILVPAPKSVEDDDAPATPPPEPVLVPTQHYTSSKLDLRHVKDPDARFAQSFWSLDTFNPESAPGPSAQVLLPRSPPEDTAEDMSPSHTRSTIVSTPQSSSTSTTRIPTDYLGRDSGYTQSGLSSFAALEETWISGRGLASGSGMGVDIPSLQMEYFVHDA